MRETYHHCYPRKIRAAVSTSIDIAHCQRYKRLTINKLDEKFPNPRFAANMTIAVAFDLKEK